MTKLLGFVVLAIIAVVHPSLASAQELSVCAFDLPKWARDANLTFNAVYQFDVSDDGIPTQIVPVSSNEKILGSADVRQCIQNWRFPQLRSKHLVAVFEWQHAIGWTRLSITGPETKLIIHIQGNTRPYSRGGTRK